MLHLQNKNYYWKIKFAVYEIVEIQKYTKFQLHTLHHKTHFLLEFKKKPSN